METKTQAELEKEKFWPIAEKMGQCLVDAGIDTPLDSAKVLTILVASIFACIKKRSDFPIEETMHLWRCVSESITRAIEREE